MRFGIARNAADGSSSSSSGSSDSDEKKPTRSIGVEPLGQEHFVKLEAQVAYTFKDSAWLERALTHRSVHQKGVRSDYERLEFLGDAVLDLAVAHLLLEFHPDAAEGDLSKMRAALVNTTSLADIARGIDLGQFIRLSKGELASGGSDRSSILADVLEAVVGAIYREGGYETARDCVAKLLGDRLKTVNPRDPKTELQEALHASGSEAPVYRLECVEGPEHAPVFISVVEVDGQIVGRGRGATKKASQQAAAEEALQHLEEGDELDEKFKILEAPIMNSDDSGSTGSEDSSDSQNDEGEKS